MPVLSRITAPNCPSLSYFYALFKSFMGNDTFSAANLAEMGSITGECIGVLITDMII